AVAICDECVELCRQIIAQEPGDRPSAPPPPRSAAPADAAGGTSGGGLKMLGKEDRLRAIGESGVVAIVRLDPADHLLSVVRAIREGGVTAIEFTMTTPGALRVLAEAARELGDEVLLGAGTVLDPETARACILAGARFVVAPTLNPRTL